MLNRAKMRTSNVMQTKPTKKPKKRVEEKPTLIVCKRNGDYIIEMQVEPGDDNNPENCSPLIYRIAPENNEERIRAKARKQRRLVRKAVQEVWSDPYHPEVCEKTCYKVYQQAIGLDPNNPDCTCAEEAVEADMDSCSCSDADVSSQCSSLEVDWEIHFSPPVACHISEE